MSLPKTRYLLDVNVLYALLAENHIHHQIATQWFNAPGLRWSVCPFTEAGFIRNATAPRPGQITVIEATEVLERLEKRPGYQFLQIQVNWRTSCKPFLKRLFGTKQITDAYLLGLAVRENLVLVTFDKAILHLAGSEYRKHVLLLQAV
jgi:toxin-antitoxin system PIN domain toxin